MDDQTLRCIKQIVSSHVGQSNGIKTKDVASVLLHEYGIGPVNVRTVRLAIKTLRDKGELICSSTGFGYFVPSSEDEFKAFIQSQYKSRAFEILSTARALEIAANKKWPSSDSDIAVQEAMTLLSN